MEVHSGNESNTDYPIGGAEFPHSTFTISLKSSQGKDDKTKGGRPPGRKEQEGYLK